MTSCFAAPSKEELITLFEQIQKDLEMASLKLAPEKIQTATPYSYLGTIVKMTTIRPQNTVKKRSGQNS